MNISKCIFAIFLLAIVSCNWAKDKTKEAVNKTGEVVAKAGAEFSQGVAEGVEKTFQNEVVLSEQLVSKGIKTGKMMMIGTDSTTDNILSAYLIFQKDFNEGLMVRVINKEGEEYGRIVQEVTGKKDEAKYVDFVFDKRTNIDSKGKLLISIANENH